MLSKTSFLTTGDVSGASEGADAVVTPLRFLAVVGASGTLVDVLAVARVRVHLEIGTNVGQGCHKTSRLRIKYILFMLKQP